MYCTPDDVRRLTRLLASEPDDAIVPYIEKAGARIDAYLSRRYAVPLAVPVPPIIASIAADMATSFILDEHTTERFKDQTTYGEVLFKRAQQDLDRVVAEGLLDGLPGVVLANPATSAGTRPDVATTTTGVSPLEAILTQW
ncbi:MAG: DUF1320 family protein [Bacillota bacterium]|nr:DUF1320 family protein [Bacillota bacterium]